MFIFSTCQVGADSAFKKEAARLFPGMRSAFARPGFVSFKTETLPEDLSKRSIFARTAAVFLGTVSLEMNEAAQHNQLVAEVWKIAAEHCLFVNRVHVFGRDPLPTGEHGFEPHIPPELFAIHRQIVAQSPKAKFLGTNATDIFHPAQPGETVLDICRIEPSYFLVGTHRITDTSPIHARYSGGIVPIASASDLVSRAYLKFNEGFLWSGIVPRSGDRCLDVGASPGGCSQFLLRQGLAVFGVDPGAIHPAVLSHPQFTHIRSRIKDMKRTLLRDVRWVTADMNVAPNYTLDALEDVVAKTGDSLQGCLFTLKLLRWELAEKLSRLLERTQTWGFANVRVKQLVFNRQEVMVASLKQGERPWREV